MTFLIGFGFGAVVGFFVVVGLWLVVVFGFLVVVALRVVVVFGFFVVDLGALMIALQLRKQTRRPAAGTTVQRNACPTPGLRGGPVGWVCRDAGSEDS
ncbi:hypothetical protein [Streptomyces sp. WAC 06783]|uniref:hypothetical protein n=1 Tax=Streptomyces sp. WAC 06783 TaxID=2203211 RepID=UPI00163CC43A|nr:hypothetical protein [Streptomyces sp. WAC 06783]